MQAKSSQDMLETLRRTGSSFAGQAGDMASDIGSKAKDWYGSISPDARSALLRGLAGAAVGGGVTGGIAALTPRDPERRGGVMGPALMGALMGGGAAAGLPYGAKLLSDGVKFKPEQGRSPAAKLTDVPVGMALKHPATAGAGGAAMWRQWADKTTTNPTTKQVTRQSEGLGSILGRQHPINAAKRMGRALPGQLRQARGAPAATLKKLPGTLLRAVKGAPRPLKILLGALAAGAVGDKYLRGDY